MKAKTRKAAKPSEPSQAERMVQAQVFTPEAVLFYIHVVNTKHNLNVVRPMFVNGTLSDGRDPGELAAMIDRVFKRVAKVPKTNTALETVVRLAYNGSQKEQIMPRSDGEFMLEVFRKHDQEGKSYRETADAVGASAEAVRKVYTRTRKSLDNCRVRCGQLADDAENIRQLAIQHFGTA